MRKDTESESERESARASEREADENRKVVMCMMIDENRKVVHRDVILFSSREADRISTRTAR